MSKKNVMKRGQVHVYTGKGKGKTTAALGLAFRACGHGWKVLMICFMKGDPNYGEVLISKKIPNFTLVQSGLSTFVKKGEPSEEDLRLASEGFEMAEKAIKQKKYDMVILDEINVAIDYGLLSLNEVLDLMDKKPMEVELIFTGRSAHPEIVKKANLVSEVLEIKHYYTKGINGREGIEY
ncbi:MAG: cob(I)yrinic acid a,c-diamide adenosyltransferase [bacterium]